MKVRQAITIIDIDGVCDTGTVFTEFCTNIGEFYPDTMIGSELDGDGVKIETIAYKYGGFDNYFMWLEPIDVKDTLWYKINEKSWCDEIINIQKTIENLNNRSNILNEILYGQ